MCELSMQAEWYVCRYLRLVITRGHEYVTLHFISCSSTSMESDPPFRYPNGVLGQQCVLCEGVCVCLSVNCIHVGIPVAAISCVVLSDLKSLSLPLFCD